MALYTKVLKHFTIIIIKIITIIIIKIITIIIKLFMWRFIQKF